MLGTTDAEYETQRKLNEAIVLLGTAANMLHVNGNAIAFGFADRIDDWLERNDLNAANSEERK